MHETNCEILKVADKPLQRLNILKSIVVQNGVSYNGSAVSPVQAGQSRMSKRQYGELSIWSQLRTA